MRLRAGHRLLLLLIAIVCGSPPLVAGAADDCRTRPYPAYDKQIAEFTTEKFFLTELVDHLPLSTCVPAPDKVLGHIVGAPDVLTYTRDIHAYMRAIEQASPRVKVFDIGRSEEGREMIVVAISDAANIARLDRYREITERLADPRALTDAEAGALLAEAKPFYWATGGLHSPETASPEMLMELAYRLAVEESPFIDNIRRNAIVLLTPVIEVDGRDRMVDIYMHRKRNPGMPQYPLTWWGHYVAHDNNRDGMSMALALSRNLLGTFFRFHPQVFHDLHESIPYLYISTGTGPYNAWLDPIVTTEWQQLAYYEVTEMTKRGTVGVWTHGFYDGWAGNYLFYIANGHNAIGRFYETFGNGGADTRVRTLGPNDTARQWYRQNPPLSKVTWSLRNNINLSQSALMLGMSNVAANGRQFLENFYLKGKRSVAKARTEGPAAWVFPADDPRPVEQARLLNLLRLQGLEVHKTTGEIRLGTGKDETVFPAASYVVRMDQPYSRMADMMLDRQYYNPRDPRSYDDTGWTFGALRNVRTTRVVDTAILDRPMDKVAGEVRVTGSVTGSGTTLVIDHNTDNTLATLRFRFAKTPMEVAEEAFELAGRTFRPGAVIVRDADRGALDAAIAELGLTAHATGSMPQVRTHALAAPRVAILHGWQSTQNDGWFRLAFDRLEIPYTYLADTAVRTLANLRERFDVIIVPPMGYGQLQLATLLRGIPKRGDTPMPWRSTPEMPNLYAEGLDQTDDIRGGLGYTGLMHLERFVNEGGLLISVGPSNALPVHGGMTEMVQLAETRQLQAPGVVVKATRDDPASPIMYGYGETLPVYYDEGSVLRVSTGFGGPQAREPVGRASGRGSATEPDVIQGREWTEPEAPPKRSPREEELFVREDVAELARAALPPRERWPRVVLRFAPEKDLLVSGMMQNGSELAERPAVVDVPHGDGHIVLFAINPMWRDQTMGSFFLVFNAMLNYEHLGAGMTKASSLEP